MSNKIKKFDGGGGIDGSGNIAGQIFAQQPSGGMNFGGAFNSMLGGSSALGGVGFDSGGSDGDNSDAELDPGLDTYVITEEDQLKAAQEYADLILKGPRTLLGTAKGIADVNAAKQKLVALGVSRDQLQDAGIDASGGISGVMGPSVSGVLGDIGQGAIDLIGAGGQKFSDIITLGTGPDVAQTLLDPISIIKGGLGGTINYSDSGKTTPLIVGNTTASGMPVGLNIPDPRAIWQDMSNEGLFPWLINNGAGLGGLASAAVAGGNTLDSTNKTGAGVGLSGASLIAAALDKDSDAVKTGAGNIAAGDVGSDSPAIKTDVRDIITGGVSSDIPVIKTGARDIVTGGVDSDSPVIKTGLMSDAELDEILTDIGGRPAVDGGYDTPAPEIKTSSAEQVPSGGGGGGGGGSDTPSGGTRTASGGPGDLVDIDYLFDFAKGLEQPFQTTEEDEDIVRAAEGGMIGNTNDFERILRIVRGI